MRWTVLVLFLVMVPFAAAQQGHIDLLALVEDEGNRSGAVVDLFLEVVPGSERVFLETVPLTKITTQVSMRFAQQIACSELEAPCGRYDFFYTIRGFPGVVGGPSAGAAATVLAISVLQNVELDDRVAITGTINSGGIIGPVGGVKEKIAAAAGAGKKTVLIPLGTAQDVSEQNETVDLVAFGQTLGIKVIEVGTLREALPYFGEFSLPVHADEFVVSDEFKGKLREVSDELCARSSELRGRIENATQIVGNLTAYADQSVESQNYYAAASYCFRANVILHQAWLDGQNLSSDDVLTLANELSFETEMFEREIEERELTTLTDLQVYMSVDERLVETRELIEALEESGDTALLGYARERFESAKSWARFFGGDDRVFVVDRERLEASCVDKLAEAEERFSYVSEFVSSGLRGFRTDLNNAYAMLREGKYERCLYAASKSKAEIDSLLGLIGVKEFEVLIEQKLGATRMSLQRAQDYGVFPIISYNYAQYAESLRGVDESSALLFAEYALEFSALDVYFDEQVQYRAAEDVFDIGATEGFLIGLGTGILFTMVYLAFAVGYVRKKTLQTPKRSRGKKR